MENENYSILFILGVVIGVILTGLLITPIAKQFHVTIPPPTYETRTATMTVRKLYTQKDVDALGGPFSGYVIASTDGIGYWTSSDAIFLGFQDGKTYCIEYKDPPQGPIITRNFGLGECE